VWESKEAQKKVFNLLRRTQQKGAGVNKEKARTSFIHIGVVREGGGDLDRGGGGGATPVKGKKLSFQRMEGREGTLQNKSFCQDRKDVGDVSL